MYDLIVIGGGPAALSAAFFAAGKNLKVVMIYQELGGKIGWLESLIGPSQQPYLPGNELVHLLTINTTARPERALYDNVSRITRHNVLFHVTTETQGVLIGRAVLIATGTTPVPLTIPGAERWLEHGLGYSPTTYAHLVAGERVAVIGGTSRAISGAAELAQSAADVFLITAQPLVFETSLQRALRLRPNVHMLEGYSISRIVGDERLSGLVIERDGETRQIAVDRVFVVLGLMPNSAIVRELVETDSGGAIVVNARHETSCPGVFAAGDVSTTFSEQVLVAIGDGARAARSAYEYLLAQSLIPESA